MSLYDKIAKWGFEIEYPFDIRPNYDYEDYDDRDDDTIYDRYGDRLDLIDYIRALWENESNRWEIHFDGGGAEFTVVKPTDTKDEMAKEITDIFTFIDELKGHSGANILVTDDYLFNSSEAGVHIRIDVTNWNSQERLRFARLFSNEFDDDKYDDYVDWMAEDVFGRNWNNWNSPFDYIAEFEAIKCDASTMTKSYNVQYEHDYRGTGRNTMEIRGYGVFEELDDTLEQLDTIKTLCKIVDMSLLLDGRHKIIDKIYAAWKIVTGQASISDWDADEGRLVN